MSRRGATSLSGILPLDKPAGLTSHDVVSLLRRVTGERRIGHAGTLDPMATGLLVALIGPATRLEPYLSSERKSYVAEIVFGTATDTEDAEGQVIAEEQVPDDVYDATAAERILGGFLGESAQRPPAYSAIKVDGKTAHRVARSGGTIELAPRHIEVFEARLEALDPDSGRWRVCFTVSKGTYVRSLARDIGAAAGTVAHLGALRRTASGALALSDAASVEDAERAARAGEISGLFADPLRALGSPRAVEAPTDDVRNGRPLEAPRDAPDGELIAVTDSGSLAALYRVRDGRLVPEVVLALPIGRQL